MKRFYILLLVIMILLVGIGCSSKSGIVGKWEAENSGQSAFFEFKKDGRMIISGPGNEQFTYYYRVKDENIIVGYETKEDYDKDINGDSITFSIEKDTLIIGEDNGIKFKRVK
jgi:hypothetical protein